MKKIFSILIIGISIFFLPAHTAFKNQDTYSSNTGIIRFTTKGPLGLIKAESKKLIGTFDAEKKSYAFSILIASFEGFQNDLQKKHYNEKYMESAKIPQATFKGKVIEDIDFNTPGTYSVRAKGIMTIHGVEKETIVKSKMIVKAGQIAIESNFNILLGDYNIKIPTIVSQQVDDNISVEVNTVMSPAK
jgi:polyisoprenoid-binding protein YceI